MHVHLCIVLQGGCQSWRKAAHQYSWIDLTLRSKAHLKIGLPSNFILQTNSEVLFDDECYLMPEEIGIPQHVQRVLKSPSVPIDSSRTLPTLNQFRLCGSLPHEKQNPWVVVMSHFIILLSKKSKSIWFFLFFFHFFRDPWHQTKTILSPPQV